MSDDIVSMSSRSEPGGIGSGTVRVSDILARGVPIRWDEAVALLQEILETVTAAAADKRHDACASRTSSSTSRAAVRVRAARRGERGPVAAGRALHALLATADVPLPLRLFVTQANAPETHTTLKAFAEGLAYFGKPGRADLIRGIYERYRSDRSGASTRPHRDGRQSTDRSHTAPRRVSRSRNRRHTAPQWLMPAAVVVAVASLAAVIWFGCSAAAPAARPTSAGEGGDRRPPRRPRAAPAPRATAQANAEAPAISRKGTEPLHDRQRRPLVLAASDSCETARHVATRASRRAARSSKVRQPLSRH